MSQPDPTFKKHKEGKPQIIVEDTTYCFMEPDEFPVYLAPNGVIKAVGIIIFCQDIKKAVKEAKFYMHFQHFEPEVTLAYYQSRREDLVAKNYEIVEPNKVKVNLEFMISVGYILTLLCKIHFMVKHPELYKGKSFPWPLVGDEPYTLGVSAQTLVNLDLSNILTFSAIEFSAILKTLDPEKMKLSIAKDLENVGPKVDETGIMG